MRRLLNPVRLLVAWCCASAALATPALAQDAAVVPASGWKIEVVHENLSGFSSWEVTAPVGSAYIVVGQRPDGQPFQPMKDSQADPGDPQGFYYEQSCADVGAFRASLVEQTPDGPIVRGVNSVTIPAKACFSRLDTAVQEAPYRVGQRVELELHNPMLAPTTAIRSTLRSPAAGGTLVRPYRPGEPQRS